MHYATELEQMNVDVRDNREDERYEIWTDGELAGFVQYRLHDGRITLIHTEIDPEHEGAGLGSQLARAALDDARVRQLAVVPVCPFIADFIRRHPDRYLDLVVPSMRAEVTAPVQSSPG
jgi:predicted GNAT family acetyltransferase